MYQKRCNGFYHEVKKGDSLYTISREHNVPLESVMLANPDVDVYNLQIGSKICVPMRCGMKPLYTKLPVNEVNMIMGETVDANVSTNIGTNMSSDMETNVSPGGGIDMDVNMNMDTQETDKAAAYTDDTFAYIVRDGDSMQHLMNKFNISPEEICRYNSMENILLKPGITIIIPNR